MDEICIMYYITKIRVMQDCGLESGAIISGSFVEKKRKMLYISSLIRKNRTAFNYIIRKEFESCILEESLLRE